MNTYCVTFTNTSLVTFTDRYEVKAANTHDAVLRATATFINERTDAARVAQNLTHDHFIVHTIEQLVPEPRFKRVFPA